MLLEAFGIDVSSDDSVHSLQVCAHFQAMCRGGGSSKLSSLLKGRAAGESPYVKLWLLLLSRFFHICTKDSLSQVGDLVMCPVCSDVLERPIELACERMIC